MTLRLVVGEASATVDPATGGRLTSLAVAGRELLVQPYETDDPIPLFGSFLLAPWVAEIGEGRLAFEGVTHQLPRNVRRHAMHGLVFDGPWDVTSASGGTVVLERALGPDWPFGGSVRQSFELDPAGITLTAEVIAGDQAMPVGLGWHPWFRVDDPSTVAVRVDAATHLELDDELLPTGRVLDVDAVTDVRAGPALADRDLDVVYLDVSSPATLQLRDLTLDIAFDPAISIVVVYTSPGAVCVEPWSSWPDAIAAAARGYPSGVQVIGPGETFRRWTRWSWSR